MFFRTHKICVLKHANYSLLIQHFESHNTPPPEIVIGKLLPNVCFDHERPKEMMSPRYILIQNLIIIYVDET